MLSIVLGALGTLGGLLVMAFSSFFSLIPVAGKFLAAAGFILSFPLVIIGVLGIVAGAQGLRGASWARWTMVVLFAIGALSSLPAFAAVLPLAITVADIVAIVMLVNAEATTWFEQVARTTSVRVT